MLVKITVIVLLLTSFLDLALSFDGPPDELEEEEYVMVNGVKMKKTVKSDEDVMGFLGTYGYMSEKPEEVNMESQSMKDTIMKYQHNMGIKETGKLDGKTMEMMNMPRCGVPDTAEGMRKYDKKMQRRFKRFKLQGSSWPSKIITWRVSRFSQRRNLLGRDKEIEDIIEAALAHWGRSTTVQFFKQTEGSVDIDIQFVAGSHGDRNAFDGPGKTLAHAFFPKYGGDAHFDDSEKWSLTSKYGVNLLSVAIHELGHSLGLAHSDQKKAIMYASYTGQRYLGEDDIEAIQKLYGKGSDTRKRTSRKHKKVGFWHRFYGFMSNLRGKRQF